MNLPHLRMDTAQKSKKLFASVSLALLLITQPGVTSLFPVFPEEASAQIPATRTWYADTAGIRSFYNQIAAQRGLTPISTDWNGQGMVSNDAVTAQKICEFAGYSTVVSRDCHEYGAGGGRCNFTSCNNNTMGVWNTPTNNMNIANACGYTWLASLTCSNPIPTSYCANGTTMTAPEIAAAIAAGKVTATFSEQSGREYIHIANTTGCTAPLVLASYKVFITPGQPGWLDTQEFIEASPVTNINATGNTDISVAVAACMTQIDLWYQQAPQHLEDSDPYHDPNHLPYVMFAANNAATNLCQHTTQCSDGIDNDGDGATDYPNDFSCSSTTDDDETNPKAQCQDGIDNDGDHLVDFPNDPGCTSRQDNDEHNGNPYCANGTSMTAPEFAAAIGAGKVTATFSEQSGREYIHITNTTGCTAPMALASYEVFITPGMPGWLDTQEFIEASPVTNINPTGTTDISVAINTACLTQVDLWYQQVPHQLSDTANYGDPNHLPYVTFAAMSSNGALCPNTPACSDGTDNEGDGFTDYPNDPGCTGLEDDDESGNDTADIRIIKTGPATVQQGGTVTYTLKVKNLGPHYAKAVKVTDAVPVGLTLDLSQSSLECLPSGSTVTCVDNTFQYGTPSSSLIAIAGDWDDDGRDTIGLYDLSSSTFFLRNSNDRGAADVTFTFTGGGLGWIPLAGDWNHDGRDGVALFNPSTKVVLLRNTLTSGGAESQFTFDSPAGFTLAIAGDWDDNGTDSIGLYNPTTSHFLLRNALATGSTGDIDVAYGAAGGGWLPIAGDWDHNGTNTIALYDPSTSFFYIANTNNGGGADIMISFGVPSMNAKPLAGDWNDDNRDGVGLYQPSNSAFYIHNILESGPAWTELRPNQERTYTLVFTMSPSVQCGSTIQNTATVQLDGFTDPNLSNNQSQTSTATWTCPVPQADLSVTKTGPSVVTQGNVITYSLTATNAGPGTATNVTIADPVPAGLTFLPSSSDPSCVFNGANVLCNNFSLNAGQSKTVAVAFTVTAGAACNSTIVNNASVSASSTDPNPANNQSQTVSSTVNCPVPQADLSITKSADKTTIQPNEYLTYTLTVSNSGPNAAQNVIVSDSLPSGVTFDVQFLQSDGFSCWQQQSDANHLVCTKPTMNVGEVAIIRFQVRVPTGSSCTPRSLLNTATVDAAGSNDPNGANNFAQTTTQLTCPVQGADLSISKTGPASVTQGNVITYSLTATNAGPGTATNVVIADPIPSGLTFNAGASDSGCIVNGANVLCNNFSLTSGQSRSFAVAFTVTAGATCNSTIHNDASVSASSTDPNPGNNQSQTVNTTVNCLTADASVTKTGPATVNQGGTITYALTASNAGPGTATNVVIMDSIPAGLAFNASGSDSHCVSNGPEVLCNNFSLTSGQARTFAVVFTVTTLAACNSTIQNQAVVSVSNTDPNPSNNVSQIVSSTVNCPNQQADLSITKTGPSTVTRGTTLTYSLVVSNAGPGTATNVVVTDAVPSGLVFNASASDTACHLNGTNVVCDNFSLTSGQSKTLALSFSVPSTATCNSTVTNTASVTSAATDPNTGNNQSQTVSTTISCPVTGADLTVQKSGPSTATVNGTVQYVLTAINAGPDSASNVVITDAIPAGLTFNAAQSDVACTQNGSNILCTLSSLPAGNIRSFVITFNIPSTFTCNAQIQNVATISSATSDPNTGNNQSQTVTTTAICQTQNADLSIIKGGPSTVNQGGTIHYTLTVANAGPGTATNVVVTDYIPSGLTFQTSGSDSACHMSGSNLVCDGFSLTSGQSKVMDVFFTVSSSQTCNSTITNIVTAAASSTDPNNANNISQAMTTVTCPSQGADLSITKTGPSSVTPGNTLTYGITVTNAGPGTATGVTVSDTTPTGLTFQTSGSDSACTLSGSTVRCTHASLTSGQSKTFNVVFSVPSAQTCNSTITNSATVTSGSTDPNTGNNTSNTTSTTVTCGAQTADLSITKSGPSTVNQGGTITYVVTATNAGPGTATNVVIADVVPSGLTFQTSGSDSSCHLNGASVLCDNFSLTSGQSKTVNIVFAVSSSQTCNSTISNAATVSTSATDPNSGNNTSSTVSATVTCNGGTPTFTITKTDNRTTVNTGEALTYQITVTNSSSVNATNVDVSDILPGGLTFVSASDGGSLSGTTIHWTIGSLTAGASKTLTLVATVPSSVAGGTVLTNLALVGSVVAQDQTTVSGGSGGGCNLSITLRDSRDPVNEGDTFTYTIEVHNQDSTTATNVSLTQTLDSNVDFVSAGSNGVSDYDSSVRWNNLTIAGNSSTALTITVRVLDGAQGDIIRSSAFACSAQDNENTLVNSGSIPPPPPPPPPGGTVTIDKQADRSEAQPGSVVSYTITIRNTSGAPTVPLTIEDSFNAGEMTVESADGGLASAGAIRWDIGSVGANVTRLITYRVRLSSSLQHGQTVSNTVRIVSSNASDIEEVHIIKQFPQTGFFGRAFTADTNGKTFLQPVAPQPRATDSASLPMVLWITLSALGLGSGSLIGKKFFLLGI